MDLYLEPAIAQGYKSASQIARLITEDWAARNLYCVACTSERIEPAANNTAVYDYQCPVCLAKYQLKGKNGAFGAVVSNSAYQTKLDAIRSGTAPNYAFVQYSTALWRVTDLFIVPGHFFTPAVVQARNALGPNARRSGWVGSNILLGAMPLDARVQVVASGVVRAPAEVRRHWDRYEFLRDDRRARGGWGAAVLAALRTLQMDTGDSHFNLQYFYSRFSEELASQFPNNHHIEPKIRQQLQVLRDNGVLKFWEPGHYEIIA